MSCQFRIGIHSSSVPVPFPGAVIGACSFIARERSHLAAAAAASHSRALRPHKNHRPRAAAAAGQEMEQQGGKPALGWAARDNTGVLSPYSFSRRYVRRGPCVFAFSSLASLQSCAVEHSAPLFSCFCHVPGFNHSL